MAFNTSVYSAEERFLVNPKHLLFTQPDIKSTFTDLTYPSVKETASMLRDGQFSPHDFDPLHVSIDERGNISSDNNRRLFAFREAAVDFVPVVFDGTRRPKKSLKSKLSDPNFMPRIRGEASRVQIPPMPTSFGWNGYQMQNEREPSHPGSVSARYWNMQPYDNHEDDEEEDELGDMFSQLSIKSTSPYPTYREGNPDMFDQSHNFDPNEFWNPNCRLYSQKEVEDDLAPVGFNGNWSAMNAVEGKPNDLAYMPRIGGRGSGIRNLPQSISGGNGSEMEKGISLMGSVSDDYSKRDLYGMHEEDETEYKYWYNEKDVEVDYEYSVSYEEDANVGYEYQGLCEAKCEEDYGYEDEGKYEHPDPCKGNGYPFPYEDEGIVEGLVEFENPVYQFPQAEEGEVEYHYIPTVFCEDDFNFSVPSQVEDDAAYIPTVFSEDDFGYRHSPYHYD